MANLLNLYDAKIQIWTFYESIKFAVYLIVQTVLSG